VQHKQAHANRGDEKENKRNGKGACLRHSQFYAHGRPGSQAVRGSFQAQRENPAAPATQRATVYAGGGPAPFAPRAQALADRDRPRTRSDPARVPALRLGERDKALLGHLGRRPGLLEVSLSRPVWSTCNRQRAARS
jgi:hypothetical protein